MKTIDWIRKNAGSLEGKVVAISGATGGLGRELCAHLATLGAELILIDRNKARSEALADELRGSFRGIKISHIIVDMENMDAVRSAADELERADVDHLILNAGAYSIPRHKCETGYDNVFQINFVSPYYLARRLLPKLAARGGKVVAVGSIAHNYSKIELNDIDFSKNNKSSKVYGNAKRYLMYSLWGLDGYLNNIVIAHPGITSTNITAHYPKLIFAVIKHPMKVIFMKPKRAALSILYGLFCECNKNEWIGPRFFDVWGMPQRKKINTASEIEAANICSVAEKIYTEIKK